MKIKTPDKIIILLGFFLLVIAFHIFAYTGHFGYDDMFYARLASDFNQGQVDLNNHYTFRLPIILLTAVSYKIFGVTDFASSLPSIFISFLTLILVFIILKNQKKIVLYFGLLLTTLNNWSIHYSDKLMPDIYVALSVLFCIFIIYRFKFGSTRPNPLVHGFFLSIGLLFGFLSKETIVLILPLLAYLFIYDLLRKRDVLFWLSSVGLSILIFVLYFGITWYYTGNVFQRFQAIINNSYLNTCSYDLQPAIILVKRVFFDYFSMMISQGMMVGLVFVIAYLMKKQWKSVFSFENPMSFFTISSVIMFLSSNFMSISLTHYVPMCPDPRHFLFIIPVASIAAAYIIYDLANKNIPVNIVLIVSAIIALLSFFLSINSFWKIYLPLFILVMYLKFAPIFRFRLHIFTLLFTLIFLFNLNEMYLYARKIDYSRQKEIVFSKIIDKNTDCYIITNQVQKNLNMYYSGFSNSFKTTFITFEEAENLKTIDSRPVYILRNWYSEYLSNFSPDDLPLFARETDSTSTLLYKNDSLNFYFYRLERMILPKTIMQSINDFEKPAQFWQQNEKDLRNTTSFNGKYSCFVYEFSPTFVYPFDSIFPVNCSKLILGCQAFCKLEKPSSAQLVISLEQNNEIYLWKALDIGKFIRAYGHWCKVKYEITVKPEEIKPASTLKIYLWNNGKKECYIDDFVAGVSAY